jgi:hypothetical protein
MIENEATTAPSSHLVKYTMPTKFDKAPYLTIWRVKDQSGDVISIQMSKDMDQPDWRLLPEILVKAFYRFYIDPLFVEEVVKLYEESGDNKKSGIEKIQFIKSE